MTNPLSPALLTFCYVKDAFDKTGDLMLGLAPLFLPIAEKLKGQPFEPKEFSQNVEAFYGISMTTGVAEEMASRLAKLGYLETVQDDKYTKSYFYKDSYAVMIQSSDSVDTEREVDALMAETKKQFLEVFPARGNYPIEKDILNALATLNFDTNESVANGQAYAETEDDKAIRAIRVIVADYILKARDTDPQRFSLLEGICSGALLSQVILTIKNPPKEGIKAHQLTVYLDTPMVVRFFGFEGPEKRAGVEGILRALKSIQATWGIFQQNTEELQRLLYAILDSIEREGRAEGELGRRITADPTLRTRARELIKNPGGMLKKAGFTIHDPDTQSPNTKSSVPARFELSLTHLIRPMGKIESREVDASSICDAIRLRGSNRASDYLKSFSLFVSPNAPLVEVAVKALRESGLLLNEEVPYVLTEAQLSGILWVATGSGGKDLPVSTLVANCVAALATNSTTVSRMREIALGVNAQNAAEFEAIIADDRCAYYLTKLTAGGALLLTKDVGTDILNKLKRHVAADVEREAEIRRRRELAAQDEKHGQAITDLSQTLTQTKAEADKAVAAEKLAREQLGRRLGELEKKFGSTVQGRERLVAHLIDLCRRHRRAVELSWTVGFAVLTGLIGVLAGQLAGLGAFGWWLSTLIGVVIGALGFHIIPNYVFGGFIEEKGEDAFLARAKYHGIDDVAFSILGKEKAEAARKSK